MQGKVADEFPTGAAWVNIEKDYVIHMDIRCSSP